MSADTKRNETPRGETRAVSAVVFAAVTFNAATQFALQAWMSYGFASEVWKLPQPLSIAVIFALDVFAVLFMLLTYLMRFDRWQGRKGFVWAVFVIAVGAQLFAAELFGAHEGWPAPVRWFAAMPAVFLALSLEGLNLWRTRTHAPEHVDQGAVPVRRDPRPITAQSTPPPKPVPPRIHRASPRADTKALAEELGVSRRRAQQIARARADETAPRAVTNGRAPAGEISRGVPALTDAPVSSADGP